MTQQDITPREALEQLATSSAKAVAEVLEMFAPGAIESGDPAILADSAAAFSQLQPGTVATSVSYVDGVTGANIFALSPAGARTLAQAMGVPPAEAGEESGDEPPELSELELSAVSEAANQMMAAAASAIGTVLGQEIDISPPDTRTLKSPVADAEKYGSAPHATSTTLLIGGESCRLIQLVPSAFVQRMVRAIDEQSGAPAAGPTGVGTDADEHLAAGAADAGQALQATLGNLSLNVSVELGRTRMRLGRALALPVGTVVDLDESSDAPVDMYVNGVRFGAGELLVIDGEWALRLTELTVPAGMRQTTVAGPAEAPETADPAEAPETADPAEAPETQSNESQREGALT